MENKEQVNKLRGAIFARYDSISQFAKEIGWSRPKVYNAIRRTDMITLQDAGKIARTLGLSPEEYSFIFIQ